MKYKLAVLVSHPIQYHAPFFQKLSRDPNIDLTVYFCWDFGVKETYDPQFGKRLKWDIPLLEGYKYKFLGNFSPTPANNFWGLINPGIVKEITRNNYDALLVFGWNALSNWLAFLTAFVKKTPVFLRGENPLNQEISKNYYKKKIKKIILGFLFRRAKAFLYIGEENKKFYEYYGVSTERLFFCPYAVDNSRFIKEARALKPKRTAIRKKLGIPKNAIVVLFVGKLMSKKRPIDLLWAYERIPQENKALVFVGDGELRHALEEHAVSSGLKQVYFAGFKNQTELPEFYAMADIFVLPSGPGETWGLVVNEAMCFGLPVIVSDIVGCASDLVHLGENGHTFPHNDAGELARCLNILIKGAAARRRAGEKSLEIIKQYNYQKDIESILAALRR